MLRLRAVQAFVKLYCLIYIPFGKVAFQDCELLKLSVVEGSYAEAYAISEGVPFQTY